MVAIAGTGWQLAPSLVAYVREADRYYPQRDRASDGSIGDLSHQARVSDHNPAADGLVHAVDIDEDLAPGLDLKAFAERLRKSRDRRIKYVIYEGRMFSSYATASRAAWEWGPYSGENAHLHHLHLSILNDDVAELDLSPWGFAPVAVAPQVVTPPLPPPIEENDDMPKVYEIRGSHPDAGAPWILCGQVRWKIPNSAYHAAAAADLGVEYVSPATWDCLRSVTTLTLAPLLDDSPEAVAAEVLAALPPVVVAAVKAALREGSG